MRQWAPARMQKSSVGPGTGVGCTTGGGGGGVGVGGREKMTARPMRSAAFSGVSGALRSVTTTLMPS